MTVAPRSNDVLIAPADLPAALRNVGDILLALPNPAFLQWGYAENAALNHGHIGPGMAVLTKPFAITELVRRVERMLGRN